MGTDYFVEYTSLLNEFKDRVNLKCLRINSREELLPYYLQILRHLDKVFIMEDLEFPETVSRIIELYDSGQEQIITDNLMEMYEEYEVDLFDDWKSTLWVDAWVELMKTTYMTLLFNYSELFTELEVDCHCSCYSDEEGAYVLPPRRKALGSSYCGCQ